MKMFALLIWSGVATAATSPGVPTAPEVTAYERMLTMAQSHHAVRPEVLQAITKGEHAALMAMARDVRAPLYVRVRALGFVGIRRDAAVEALWAEARGWPERELRIQAALSQVMAVGEGEAGVASARALLAEREARLREVGINRLAALGAVVALEAHAKVEGDEVLRELIRRRVTRLRAAPR